MGLNLADIRDLPNTVDFLGELWPLDFSMVDQALDETLVTLEIAFLGTFFGLVVGFPCAFLAARNTAPRAVYHGMRGFLTFLRSVPELAIAVVLVPTFGLAPLDRDRVVSDQRLW